MAKQRKPPSAQLSKEKAAQLVSEAACKAPGETDEDVCKRWDISTKTLSRYRKMVAADPLLSAEVDRKNSETSKGWETERLRFLRDSIRKMGQLVQDATVAELRQVAGAIKIVGDLHSLSRALGTDDEDGKQPRGDRPGKAAAGAPRPDAGSGGAEADPPVH